MTKYLNKPCEIDGQKYRSRKEAKRHQELLILQRVGTIAGLTREVPFQLAPGVKLPGEKRARPPLRYVADFVYSTADGRQVVEDCKGMRTPVYRIKRHLMATVLGINVLES